MNQIKILPLIILFITLLVSCEKVIEIDLKESEKQIVIEANLESGMHDFSVYISKTAPYFESKIPETMESAKVTLTDDENNSFNIPHIGNGTYTAEITGEPLHTYNLSVEIEGVEYHASSYLPELVKIDSVYSIYEEAFGPRESGHIAYFRYTDPANVPNYYRALHYLNGELENSPEDLFVMDDELNDGNSPQVPFFMKVFQSGDTVRVELIHFDEASYDYFYTLSEIIGSDGGPSNGLAAPSNPTTNWSGGILGYFSAYSSDTLSTIIQ